MADQAEKQNSNQIDQYQLVNVIATGGISQIWEVKHVATQQPYAMKLLLPESFADKTLRAELKTEANTTKLFEHPAIVRVMDINISRDHAYFVMEHFRSTNLKQMIRSDLGGAQSRLKKIAENLCSALALVHEKGWLHRDIKPDNLLVNRGGEIRLIDFSLASKIPSGFAKMMTSKGRVVIQGTRTYMAPELVERSLPSVSSDIYGLGVMLYEVLTGRPPFVSKNPNELLMMHIRDIPDKPSGYNPNVSSEMDQAVMGMLAKKPKDRPATMNEVFSVMRSIQMFKEDPAAYHQTKTKAAEEKQAKSLDVRVDSRVDALRTPEERKVAAENAKEIARQNAASRAEAEKMMARRDAAKGGKPAAASAAPAPAAAPQPAPMPMPMPMPMPGMYPGMPQFGQPGMPPGYPMPGMPMPGYMPGMPMPGMMPGMPGPGMMPPGMPMPGQGMPPGMPQPGMPQPGMPMPGMPAPGMPFPGMGAPGAPPAPPGMPAPAAAQQPPRPAAPIPAKAAPAPKPAPVDDLPLMDELPDVL